MKYFFLFLILIILSSSALAIEISQVRIFPNETLQGGSVDLCLDVIENNPKAFAEIVMPNGGTRTYELVEQDTPFCFDTLNGVEMFYRFTDSQQQGDYSINFTAEKGGDMVDTQSGFSVVPLSVVVDYVSSVGSVDTCKTVDEILEPSIEVHGTEYEPDQRAKVWLQLLNGSNDPILDASCRLHLIAPDSSSYVEDTVMINLHHDGIYYYDLIAPQAQGVYPAVAECYYDVTTNRSYVNTSNIITGTYDAGEVYMMREIDGDEYKIREVANYLNVDFNINDMCGVNTPEDLLTSLAISVNLKRTEPETNDNLVINVYNFTSSTWFELPNRIITPNDRVTVTNTIFTNNLTSSGLVNSSGGLRIKFNDTYHGVGRQDGKTEFDMVVLDCEQLANPEWSTVKGSSEIHVSSDTYWTTSVLQGNITNETLEGYFYVDFLVSSLTSITEEDEQVYFDMYAPFPCHHVLNVSIDGVDWTWWGSNPSSAIAGCRVNWLMDLDKNTNYLVQIKSDKWFEQEEDNWVSQAQLDRESIFLACENYRLVNGFPSYPIPITYDPKRYNDTFYAACNQYLDTFYHFNKTYYEEFETGVIILTAQQMEGLDNTWYHLQQTFDELQSIADNLLITLVSGGTYSTAIIANPTGQDVPYFATYFANISTSYLNYLRTLVIDTEVWEYTGNRTLTGLDSLWVGGTEYSPDEETGKVVVRLVDSTDNPVNNAQCNLTVAYPNNTLLFDAKPMPLFTANLTGNPAGGIYLTDFNLSNSAGVYPYGVDCYVSSGASPKRYFLLDTFHVFGANETQRVENIWNYENRTLSTFDFEINATATVNETLITESVWSYSGTIATNILEQIADAIWEFVGGVAEII